MNAGSPRSPVLSHRGSPAEDQMERSPLGVRSGVCRGSCRGAIVSIVEDAMLLPVGGGFNLSCDFTCLEGHHVAQLWRKNERDTLSLVNMTSIFPNMTMVLSISSATKADAGSYFCMTQPPDTISPLVFIQIADNLTASTMTTPSTPQPDSIQQKNSAAGVRQALWLTKTKLISGLPPQLLSLAEDPANQIPDQDERVQNAIRHARFWDTTQPRPGRARYSNTLLLNLLNLCAALQPSHPAIGRRILAEKYSLAATWKRGNDLFQIRGQNGLLHNCMDPLPEVSGKQEVSDTADHVLETFYPVSPTIDLQKVHVYQDEVNCPGFRDDYPYPHAHTLYFLEDTDASCKLRPEQFRAKMVMFAFGNALARAHKLYGVPAGLAGYKPETFTKFLALYLHGAV
ncbi:39S ribosomal protein L37 [Nibea albiflora]|uniref:39S ribosomal protein L37 n=1 Tax=Nibea albiflora TaxID=240163 RepID=A0ACB7FHE9_NIBAL|nr:39S ribosomal protein L37 [Nibea albiflora]